MTGTKAGGQKAAKTNKERHGEGFYARIGAKGGMRTGVEKGFAANPTLAKIAGKKGGSHSRRGAQPVDKDGHHIRKDGTRIDYSRNGRKPKRKGFLSKIFGGK